MEPKSEYIRDDLGIGTLFADDIAALSKILSVEGKYQVTLECPGWKLKPEEFSKLDKAPSRVTLTAQKTHGAGEDTWLEPIFKIDTDRRGVVVSGTESTEAHGLSKQVGEYLDAHCRPMFYWAYRTGPRGVVFGLLLSLSLPTALLAALPLTAGARWVLYPIGWIATNTLYNIAMFYFVETVHIELVARRERQAFLVSNRDRILLILVGVMAGQIPNCVGWLIRRAENSSGVVQSAAASSLSADAGAHGDAGSSPDAGGVSP